MATLKINPNKIDKNLVGKAANILKGGGVVAFPTETVYGLGADATNDNAIKRIFEIKGRPYDNPLIAHVSSAKQAKSIVAHMPEIANKLINTFWPGPLTIVFKKNRIVSDVATCGLDTLAVRMPANKIALALIEKAGVPIVAPSANLSGRPSPTMASHVEEDMGDLVDLIIDGGETRIGIESTVVDASGAQPQILRLGSITPSQIEKATGMKLAAIGQLVKEEARPKAPGMKYTHYSPHAKVVLVQEPNASKKIKKKYQALLQKGKQTAIMTFKEYEKNFAGCKLKIVSSINNPKEYMHKLYAVFRELDKQGIDIILAHAPPETESWLAATDRLKKAATEVL